MNTPFRTTIILVVAIFSINRIAFAQNIIQSSIISNFEGFNYGNIYELGNGQIWKQTEHWIWYWYWVYPKVTLYPENGTWKMKVENIDHPVTVEQIK